MIFNEKSAVILFLVHQCNIIFPQSAFKVFSYVFSFQDLEHDVHRCWVFKKFLLIFLQILFLLSTLFVLLKVKVSESVNHSIVSDSLRPHEL